MVRKNFELFEFVVVALFGIVGLADVVLIIATMEEGKLLEACHHAVQSFLLATLASFCSIMLVRWYRHQHEILETLKMSTDLLRHDKIVTYLRDIVADCTEIRQKRWPEFAEFFLTSSLRRLKGDTGKLKSGQMTLALDIAQSFSPKFFTVTRGQSFVTAYGNWIYWKTPHGQSQLQANNQAIKGKFGPIIRVFIVPNIPATDFPSDETIENQIKAGIDLMAISEDEVRTEFRRDVGVFFDGNRDEVVFMSEWIYPSSGQGGQDQQGYATLTFDGEPLSIGKRMHDSLTKGATSIKHLDDWAKYKEAAGSNGAAKAV